MAIKISGKYEKKQALIIEMTFYEGGAENDAI